MSGIDNIKDYNVVVTTGHSYFEALNGVKEIGISINVKSMVKAGKLIEVAHELEHANQFARVLAKNDGNVALAEAIFDVPFYSKDYALGEVAAEVIARHRITNYLGRLPNKQRIKSQKYSTLWLEKYRKRRR